MTQERKLSLVRRVLLSNDCWTRYAVEARQSRTYPFPYIVALSPLYPFAPRPSFWVFSLIPYGEMDSASLVCQLSPSPDKIPSYVPTISS